jgi:hypothetical protein
MPALDASNYQVFDTALAALFEPLAPWTAAIILQSWEDFEFDYCRWKGIGQYLELLMPELHGNLDGEAIRVLGIYLEGARSNIEDLDRKAAHRATIKAMKTGERRTPPPGKLARIKQLVRLLLA